MGEIRKHPALELVSTEPDQEIIDDLIELLKRARSGEIKGFAFATLDSDGSFTTGWNCATENGYRLAHARRRLDQNVLDSCTNEDE